MSGEPARRAGREGKPTGDGPRLTAAWLRENPVAAVGLGCIVAAYGWQAAVATAESGPVLGAAVLATGYVAYRLARVWWRVQNATVAAAQARERLEGGER